MAETVLEEFKRSEKLTLFALHTVLALKLNDPDIISDPSQLALLDQRQSKLEIEIIKKFELGDDDFDANFAAIKTVYDDLLLAETNKYNSANRIPTFTEGFDDDTAPSILTSYLSARLDYVEKYRDDLTKDLKKYQKYARNNPGNEENSKNALQFAVNLNEVHPCIDLIEKHKDIILTHGNNELNNRLSSEFNVEKNAQYEIQKRAARGVKDETEHGSYKFDQGVDNPEDHHDEQYKIKRDAQNKPAQDSKISIYAKVIVALIIIAAAAIALPHMWADNSLTNDGLHDSGTDMNETFGQGETESTTTETEFTEGQATDGNSMDQIVNGEGTGLDCSGNSCASVESEEVSSSKTNQANVNIAISIAAGSVALAGAVGAAGTFGKRSRTESITKEPNIQKARQHANEQSLVGTSVTEIDELETSSPTIKPPTGKSTDSVVGTSASAILERRILDAEKANTGQER